jgi:arylsulfatase A-like enzyme
LTVLAFCVAAVLILFQHHLKAGVTYPDANVLLVSIDTLRPDHLGCYGYGKPTSPNVDSFSEDCILFEQAIAPAPSTLSSHASMLTSLIPSRHTARHALNQPLPAQALTVAEVMKESGYGTAAFVGGGQLAEEFGCNQGFETYETITTRFDETVSRFQEWLKDHPGEKFFVFLHTYEVHHPYTPDARHQALFDEGYSGPLPAGIQVELLKEINDGKRALSEEDTRHIVAAYDGEIHSMDESFGRLIALLRKEELYDKTLIVFTSDHGEEFGEHGSWGWHSHTLYDELLKVPLLVKLPCNSRAPLRVREQARIIDIVPTVLEVVGLPVPPASDGVSLLTRGEDRQVGFQFAIGQRDWATQDSLTSLRTGVWKLYGPDQLFHLVSDANEKRNVAAENRAVTRALQEQKGMILSLPKITDSPAAVELDAQTLRALRSLGYFR